MSYRTSPPLEGVGCPFDFANRRRCRRSEAPKLLISPLEGEMAGRPERGASRRRLRFYKS
ncbi:MAG: propionyl-coenzyme A carboxylase alpha polypeptide [Mesorhizobium sp.]|nr:MAG: propionyl-coenzyme A carboxylase alpha polypeptide [Mesorhizobium sp.]TJW59082.1 MAG: propionyl-coenzyme A carboxylase alpha polypeptide [Mesorhizobium sp.]